MLFTELNHLSKIIAIDTIRTDDKYMDYNWWDDTTTYFEGVLSILGFTQVKTMHSGSFYNKGDGARFTGLYAYKEGTVEAVKAYAPSFRELNRIAQEIEDIQFNYDTSLEAIVKANATMFVNKETMSIGVFSARDLEGVTHDDAKFAQLCRDLSEWYFDQLQAHYEYMISDEEISAYLTANVNRYSVHTECNGVITRHPSSVTDGYHAFCPHCNKDLYTFDVKIS